jgi:hypothetical protein
MKPLLSVLVLGLSVASGAAQEVKCDQEASRHEVQKLTTAGTIISIDQFPPYATAIVDQRRWNRSSFEEKTAMAQHIDCATVGPDNIMLRTVIFRSNRDNLELGIYSRNELKLP